MTHPYNKPRGQAQRHHLSRVKSEKIRLAKLRAGRRAQLDIKRQQRLGKMYDWEDGNIV